MSNLRSILTDISKGFNCFRIIEPVLKIIHDPFSEDLETFEPEIQFELADLQNGPISKRLFFEENDICRFYKISNREKYPNLLNLAMSKIVIFAST